MSSMSNWILITATLHGMLTACAHANDTRPLQPDPTIAEFTRRVQPLLFNRCASGACHGGTQAGSLQFKQRDFSGNITREITLGNMKAILEACGTKRSPASLFKTIAGRHPKHASTPQELARPLSPQERVVLEGWLTTALHDKPTAAPRVSHSPNRFKQLIDNAANPPVFPAPQEPKGIILK